MAKSSEAANRGAAPPTVSARWMVGALLVVIAAAAVCAYATMGLLFYQGQWQFLLHPVKTITTTPRAAFQDVRFDVTDTGTPQLDGWWIPADAGARWSGDTLLYLHGGVGSLSDCAANLDALHALGINIFAFDYRGYGRSSRRPHPTETRMDADANAAWNYLARSRHIAGANIILYGSGVGATIAATLAANHDPAGLVLNEPNESAWKIIDSDGRAKILPLRLLMTERFDPGDTLKSLAVPKLFVGRGDRSRAAELYRESASPKEYAATNKEAVDPEALQQFLGQILN